MSRACRACALELDYEGVSELLPRVNGVPVAVVLELVDVVMAEAGGWNSNSLVAVGYADEAITRPHVSKPAEGCDGHSSAESAWSTVQPVRSDPRQFSPRLLDRATFLNCRSSSSILLSKPSVRVCTGSQTRCAVAMCLSLPPDRARHLWTTTHPICCTVSPVAQAPPTSRPADSRCLPGNIPRTNSSNTGRSEGWSSLLVGWTTPRRSRARTFQAARRHPSVSSNRANAPRLGTVAWCGECRGRSTE